MTQRELGVSRTSSSFDGEEVAVRKEVGELGRSKGFSSEAVFTRCRFLIRATSDE